MSTLVVDAVVLSFVHNLYASHCVSFENGRGKKKAEEKTEIVLSGVG